MGYKLNLLLVWSNPYSHKINRNVLQKSPMLWNEMMWLLSAHDMSGIALVYNSDKKY